MKRIFIAAMLLSVMIISNAYSQQEGNLDGELNEVIRHYYLNPQPDKVPALLEQFISSDGFKKNQVSKESPDFVIAYSFGRIAQLNSALLKKYNEIFEKASHDGRLFVLKVFTVCGDDQTKQFLSEKAKDKKYENERSDIDKVIKEGIPVKLNPLTNEIKGPSDLDLLWAEFTISGNEKEVQKIISVLNWPDRVADKIKNYLKSPVSIDKKEQIVKLLSDEYNIKCNIPNSSIETKGDIDILIILHHLQHGKNGSESFKSIKTAVGLNKEDIDYMSLKGSANWSLIINAQQYEKVFEICDAAIQNYAGYAKIALLRIAAYGYMTINDIDKAADRLRQLVALDPADEWGHYSLGSIYVKNKDIGKAKGELRLLQGLNEKTGADLNNEIEYATLDSINLDAVRPENEQVDYNKIAQETIAASKKVESYESKFYVKDFTDDKLKDEGFINIEFSIQYEKPDKFSVGQVSRSEHVADKWITIGKKSYFQIGSWFEEPEESGKTGGGKSKTNQFLSQDKYIAIMEKGKVKSGDISRIEGKEFVLLRYRVDNSQGGQFNIPEGSVNAELRLLIDKDTKLISKASLKIAGTDKNGQKADIEFEQLFMNYNKKFNIEKPEVLDLGEVQNSKPKN